MPRPVTGDTWTTWVEEATIVSAEPARKSDISTREPGPLAAFGYPKMFSHLLNTLADRIMSVEHVASVLLVGSTSRGEAAVRMVDRHLEVFGDLEFIVVTSPGRASYSGVSSAVRAVQAEWAGRVTKPIRIDFTLIPFGRLHRLEKKLFVFEVKERGICLRGRNVLAQLPTVTVGNLSFYELDELLLHRLEALLKAVEGPVEDASEDSVRLRQWYSVARNYLDVATLLLPYVGVLLPSYVERAKYVAEHPELEFLPYLPRNFTERVTTYTEWKRRPDNIPLDQRPDLHGCLLALESGERWVHQRLRRRVFKRYYRRRRVLRALQAAVRSVVRGEASLLTTLRWLWGNPLESRYRFLLDLLHSVDGICCDGTRLHEARSRLAGIALKSSCATSDGKPAWMDLRREYLASWEVYHPQAIRQCSAQG